MDINALLEELLKAEGGYSNNKFDSGGETNFGVTKAVAIQNGYKGDMKTMPKSVALDIYKKKYWIGPGFDKVAAVYPEVAAELFDCGVNMGPAVGVTFLQRSLNVFNAQQKLFADIAADGGVGPQLLTALAAFNKVRGAAGEKVLLKAMVCLRGARYVELSEKKETLEEFTYGWINNRVNLH